MANAEAHGGSAGVARWWASSPQRQSGFAVCVCSENRLSNSLPEGFNETERGGKKNRRGVTAKSVPAPSEASSVGLSAAAAAATSVPLGDCGSRKPAEFHKQGRGGIG